MGVSPWVNYGKMTKGADGSLTFTVKFDGFTPSDINRIIVQADKANEKNLKKAGAFIRTSAIRSMRRRKKKSAPGTPPNVHSKHPYANLRNVLFNLEGKGSLVVGPALFKQPKNQDRLATNIHEFGGSVSLRKRTVVPTLRKRAYKAATPVQKANYIRKLKNGTLEKKLVFTYQQIQAYYAKRPYMLPALEKEKPNFPSIWESTISQ